MLLALWSGFWNPAAWTPGSASATATPVVVINSGAGSGNYERASWEFWEAREAMMRRFMPQETKNVPVDEPRKPQAEKIVQKINHAVQILPKMPDMAHLYRMEKLLSDLAGQLDKLVIDSDEDALLALLL